MKILGEIIFCLLIFFLFRKITYNFHLLFCYIYYTFSQLTNKKRNKIMRQVKVVKSSQKKKRFSQTKHGYQHRFSPYQPNLHIQVGHLNSQHHNSHIHTSSNPHNQGHNRSQSIGNKKLQTRFKTDYEDYQNRDRDSYKDNSQQKQQKYKEKVSLDKNYKKTYYSKKRNDTQSFSYKQSFQQAGAVLSTKSNARKNLQLRVLFNKTKHGEQNKKGYTAHHPLLKYVTNKNKQYTKSPYTSQIQRFQSLYAKMKSSASKGKRTPSNQQKNTKDISFNVNVNLNKNQIRIDPQQGYKQQTQQQTVKTIKKQKTPKERQQERQRQRQRERQKQREKQRERQRNRDKQKDRGGERGGQKQQKIHTSKSKNSQVSANPDSDQQQGYGLTQQEEQTFGNRFPYGFQKIKLLGRGGFSLVWLGRHIKSGKQFAIKQIITQNTHQTHIKQIWFGSSFFTLGGIPKPQYTKFPGIKNLVRMYSYEINQSDTWIFYQKCGNSLGSNLYDIKAQRVYGEQRLYKIYYKPFYKALADDSSLLKNLIIQICKPLVVLNTCQIVHSDLKTQNILIKYQMQGSLSKYKLTETKLIDYGSSFEFKNISQFSMATPEYMPPEILNYIIHQNQGQYEQDLYQQVMNNYKNPWIVDIFSLGCVLLEIVVGVPLWMSLPLLVPSKTGTSYCQKQGLFAVKGRLFPQIIQKQRKVIARLDQVLTNQNYSKISLSPATRAVIKGMLSINFNQRISPNQAIQMLEAQKDY